MGNSGLICRPQGWLYFSPIEFIMYIFYSLYMYVYRPSKALSLPRLSAEEEENPGTWQPFGDPNGMMDKATRQLAVDDW